MTVYSIAATILAVIGVISAIIGTGYFAIGTNYKQSISSLQESLKIQKELADAMRVSGENKDKINGELSARNASLAKELESAKINYNDLIHINIALQKEKVFYRQNLIHCYKEHNLGAIPEYVDNDDGDTIYVPNLIPPSSVRKAPRE